MFQMFQILLSSLPFNPSLIDQVAFYARRLKKDAAARRAGFFLMALTMFVQAYAVISPPAPTLASSSNDLIQGGVRSAEDAARACRANANGFGDIMDQYDISCDNLAAAASTTVDSKDFSGQLMTMGKLAYGKTGETPVSVKGKTLWLRPLKNWDNGSSKHQALQGTSKTGGKFYIIKSCGGLTFVGTPPAPKPKCEWNTALLASDPRCYRPCPVPGKQNLAQSDPKCAEPCPVNGKKHLGAQDPNCFENCPVNGKQSLPKDSASCFTPCAYNSAIANSSPDCKPCEASLNSQDSVACLVLTKAVRNDTQNIQDASGTTARPGDQLTYTLSARNQGLSDVDSFIIQENISDVLDYADLENLNGAGREDNIIFWGAEAVKAGATLSKQFSVTVKNPLPGTPASASDPGHFDLTMTNVYGNAATIKLPVSAVKSIETAARTLPNTGPGASLFISFSFVTLIGYFYARSRLMARELSLVIADQSSAGGS